MFTLAPYPKGYIHSFYSVGRRWDTLLQSCLTLEIVVEHIWGIPQQNTDYSSGFVFTSGPGLNIFFALLFYSFVLVFSTYYSFKYTYYSSIILIKIKMINYAKCSFMKVIKFIVCYIGT